MLTSDTAVIVETGDSWFNCEKLKLPEGCGYTLSMYEFHMQYGSIWHWILFHYKRIEGVHIVVVQVLPKLLVCVGMTTIVTTTNEAICIFIWNVDLVIFCIVILHTKDF